MNVCMCLKKDLVLLKMHECSGAPVLCCCRSFSVQSSVSEMLVFSDRSGSDHMIFPCDECKNVLKLVWIFCSSADSGWFKCRSVPIRLLHIRRFGYRWEFVPGSGGRIPQWPGGSVQVCHTPPFLLKCKITHCVGVCVCVCNQLFKPSLRHSGYLCLLASGLTFVKLDPRSRPVIHVIRDISVQPQYINLTQHNCKGREGVW